MCLGWAGMLLAGSLDDLMNVMDIDIDEEQLAHVGRNMVDPQTSEGFPYFRTCGMGQFLRRPKAVVALNEQLGFPRRHTTPVLRVHGCIFICKYVWPTRGGFGAVNVGHIFSHGASGIDTLCRTLSHNLLLTTRL